MLPPSCRHGILLKDWHITKFEVALAIVARNTSMRCVNRQQVIDLVVIIRLFKKYWREKNGYLKQSRKGEQQIAELKALQEKGMQIAVPIRCMRKSKNEQLLMEVADSDVHSVKNNTSITTQPMAEETTTTVKESV
ncbi:hypothetical protein Y032_0114g428 [Ancylostoma ceylanicum]|uniref:Uncharacterized protein n=2 Tax=Ancylostoma ceylanicum TaxID=53326 RepID=A0A016TD24_9BILA|nr:hypothetical protein Y032_0114g428 [Ancylostoma ceylanicum]